MTLTYKQRRFVDEFMIDRNAAQAALRAGYGEKCARSIGSAMLAHYKVRAEVDRRSAELSDRASVAAIQVIEKLWAIVRANIADYLIVDADGQIRLDPSKISGEQAAPIAALATEGATADGGGGTRAELISACTTRLPRPTSFCVISADTGIGSSMRARMAGRSRSRR